MKVIYGIVLYLCSITSVFSQKETTQTLDATHINTIQIQSNEVFKITLLASNTKDITLKTTSEGEYFQNIAFTIERIENTITLTSKYPEILTSGYDKLSAHKVFAVQALLEVPSHLNVSIKSNLASVYGQGTFKNLQIELKSGQCHLKNFIGNAVINTYKGDVEVETTFATLNAKSRHGKVENGLKYTGENIIKVRTIDGNIKVLQSQ